MGGGDFERFGLGTNSWVNAWDWDSTQATPTRSLFSRAYMAEGNDWSFTGEPDEEPDCQGISSAGFRPRRSCRSALPDLRRLLAERVRRSYELEVLSGDWASAFANLFGDDL